MTFNDLADPQATHEKDSHEALTRELLVQLGLEFHTQFHCIADEVSRAQKLLSDAIANLQTAFTAIHEALERFPLTSAEAQETGLQGMHDILAEDLNAAVRALQFQDITTQLLDHVRHRLDDMTRTLDAIVAAAVTQAEFTEFLRVSRQAVLHHSESADARGVGPVIHAQCDAGDIELF